MKIKPEILKLVRKHRKLTQQELAKNANLGLRAIKRLENLKDAKTNEPRQTTVEKLCLALRVDEAQLSGEKELPEDMRIDKPSTRQTMSFRWGRRSEMQLIKRVYGVSSEQLINMAPLLFVMMAEGSFKWRRSKIKQLSDAMTSCSDANHLSFFHGIDHDMSNFMWAEEQSIASRDVFGDSLQNFEIDTGYHPDNGNPFSDYLCVLAKELLSDLDADEKMKILDIDANIENNMELPHYDLLQGELDKVCAGSSLCEQAIRWEDITIEKIPTGLQSDPEKFEAWLRENTSETTQALADISIPEYKI